MLTKRPAITLIAVLTLALGVGAEPIHAILVILGKVYGYNDVCERSISAGRSGIPGMLFARTARHTCGSSYRVEE
jgi:hypothetical protein